jgi:GH15 family glucan-1,4-alpha-glucosidase
VTTMTSFNRLSRIILHQWKGKMDFLYAQGQVIVILIIAYIGNNWKYTYERNKNQNYTLFWLMNAFILIVGLYTMKHTPNPRNTIQILSRSQTEEWKGWMQWAFIMVRIYISLLLCFPWKQQVYIHIMIQTGH